MTGGAGFIGSHLVEALLAAGDEVVVIDDLSTGHRENLGGALESGELELVVGDIRDAELMAREVERFGPERAFHLAAQADVRRAVADPAFDAEVNVGGMINLLEALRAGASKCRLVFASTGGVIYGEGEGRELPFEENSRLAPETAYGASKLSGEVYLGLYRRLHGMAGVALRFGNVYGPRQDPHGEAGVIAIFCGKLLAGEQPTIFGSGRQTRDYVYVGDVVAAILAASEQLAARGPALEGPYNVGTGVETSVLDLVEGLAAAAGREVSPVHAPDRAGEIARVAIDPTAAARDLSWSPTTDLEAGLSRAWESFASS